MGGSARAQSGAAPGEAKRHFERGLRLYDGHSYDEAIVELRASYQIDPRPEILYALGQAQRMNHQCKEAIVSYEAYLHTGPAARQEAAARDQIGSCRAELAAETGAPDKPVASPVPTPAHEAAPQAAGGSIAMALPAAPTGPPPAPAEAIRAAPLPAAHEQSAPLYRRWWFWALIGGGVAAGLAIAASAGAFTRTMEPGCPSGRYCIP